MQTDKDFKHSPWPEKKTWMFECYREETNALDDKLENLSVLEALREIALFAEENDWFDVPVYISASLSSFYDVTNSMDIKITRPKMKVLAWCYFVVAALPVGVSITEKCGIIVHSRRFYRQSYTKMRLGHAIKRVSQALLAATKSQEFKKAVEEAKAVIETWRLISNEEF